MSEETPTQQSTKPVAKPSLEDRVAALEAEVMRLKSDLGNSQMSAALSRGGGHGY